MRQRKGRNGRPVALARVSLAMWAQSAATGRPVSSASASAGSPQSLITPLRGGSLGAGGACWHSDFAAVVPVRRPSSALRTPERRGGHGPGSLPGAGGVRLCSPPQPAAAEPSRQREGARHVMSATALDVAAASMQRSPAGSCALVWFLTGRGRCDARRGFLLSFALLCTQHPAAAAAAVRAASQALSRVCPLAVPGAGQAGRLAGRFQHIYGWLHTCMAPVQWEDGPENMDGRMGMVLACSGRRRPPARARQRQGSQGQRDDFRNR